MPRIIIAIIVSLCFIATLAHAQTNAFTYQGSLADSGGVADGLYDFQFTIYTTLTGNGTTGAPDEHLAVEVTDGLFSVQLDFGSFVFAPGSDRFLEIAVRFDGDPTYTTLDPRVQLDSVPFASHADHADTADYASDGPFEPVDITPTSRSGVGGQLIISELNIAGDVYTAVDPVFPITLSREISIGASDPNPGPHQGFTIAFSRPHNPSSQWEAYFDQATSPVNIEIVTDSPPNRTTFNFTGGIVSGYRMEQDRFLAEVITITFQQPPVNPDPIAQYVTRSTNGFNPVGHGPYAPYLGGDSVLPETYFYEFDRFVPLNSSVGVFPGMDRIILNGFPSNGIVERRLTLLHNVYEDRFNTLWDQFTHIFPAPDTLELLDTSGSIWSAPSQALISAWTLDIADDGGLFEAYEFVYHPSPAFP